MPLQTLLPRQAGNRCTGSWLGTDSQGPREPEESQPAAPGPGGRLTKQILEQSPFQHLGRGPGVRARGQEGNPETFYHLNNFPCLVSHKCTLKCSPFFFFPHFYFILTNAQTFLPQIILGQVTSRKSMRLLSLTKRQGGSSEIFWLWV